MPKTKTINNTSNEDNSKNVKNNALNFLDCIINMEKSDDISDIEKVIENNNKIIQNIKNYKFY